MPADLQTYSNPWLKVQCLRAGSTINRGPPGTNFVGESNPTSQTLTHTLQKLNTLPHAPQKHKIKHTLLTQGPQHSTPVKETQHKRSQHQVQHKPPRLGPCSTRTPRLGPCNTRQPPCSTPMKETQHKRAQTQDTQILKSHTLQNGAKQNTD